jgi:hypothetical protein
LEIGLADLEERFLDTINLDHLPVVDLGAKGPLVVVDGRLKVMNGNGHMVDLG